MADLVDFINDRKRNLPELKNSKVVVIGGGYAGNLATWLRLKESNIVHAAVASSAPIQATMDFYSKSCPLFWDALTCGNFCRV